MKALEGQADRVADLLSKVEAEMRRADRNDDSIAARAEEAHGRMADALMKGADTSSPDGRAARLRLVGQRRRARLTALIGLERARRRG